MGTIAPFFTDMKPRRQSGREDWLTEGLPRIQEILGARPDTPADVFTGALPFAFNDTTVGAENELQAVVAGAREHVDFPITIERSNYYQNLLTRAGTGGRPPEPGHRPGLEACPERPGHPRRLPRGPENLRLPDHGRGGRGVRRPGGRIPARRQAPRTRRSSRLWIPVASRHDSFSPSAVGGLILLYRPQQDYGIGPFVPCDPG